MKSFARPDTTIRDTPQPATAFVTASRRRAPISFVPSTRTLTFSPSPSPVARTGPGGGGAAGPDVPRLAEAGDRLRHRLAQAGADLLDPLGRDRDDQPLADTDRQQRHRGREVARPRQEDLVPVRAGVDRAPATREGHAGDVE